MIYLTHSIWKDLDQKNQLNRLVSWPDISRADIASKRCWKGLGARPLCLWIIIRHILLGFVSKTCANTTWKKSMFRCPPMINGTDLRRSPLVHWLILQNLDHYCTESVIIRNGARWSNVQFRIALREKSFLLHFEE